MRKIILGVCMALLLGASAAAQDEAAVAAWANTIAANGWTLASLTSPATAVFRRAPERLPNGNVIMWTRYEYQSPTPCGTMSYVELTEFNCGTTQTRTLQQVTYMGSNQSRDSRVIAVTPKWAFEIPGTIGETMRKLACP